MVTLKPVNTRKARLYMHTENIMVALKPVNTREAGIPDQSI